MQEVINEQNFAEKVYDDPGKVLVEFFATWCPHCQRQQPITDEVAEKLSGQVAVYQVDIDQSPDLAEEYAPQGFPTYVLFEAGQPVASHSGEWPEQDVMAMVEDN